ncbi:hypothetical protein BU24DRAFT_417001 [Aaosphaeria arxii CBS 175.79]|uniref:Uncharacterized protein n=1 Tax=Aaosphaeria arxii CBS 175.79 TaxID=1450172 RepID=A0A6A5Y8J9_9PLEO|nr:uncharacterized protein BU24DRAFT_417001 [Aaosphaeria arxii CBS 175.79]KAF2021337.1 hypothetical protein BU24DRAFT_417001 [Aaosphaeria arxii CBS 175.79]
MEHVDLTELLDLAVDIKFPSTRLWEISPAFRASKSALRKFYHDTYGCDRHRTRHSYNDPVALFFIWDYWQDTLKNLICRRPLSNMRWDPQAESLEHLWDYEAGDELLIAKD